MRIKSMLEKLVLLTGLFMASCVTTDLDRSTSEDGQDQVTSSNGEATSTSEQGVFQQDPGGGDGGGGATCTTSCIYNCWQGYAFQPSALYGCQIACCGTNGQSGM